MIKKILSVVCIAGSVLMFSCTEGSRENQFEDGSQAVSEDQPTQSDPTVHPDNTTGSATYGDGDAEVNGSNATGTTAGVNAGSTTVGNTTSGNAGTTVGSEYDGNTTGINNSGRSSAGTGTGTTSGTTAGAGTTSGANSGGTTGNMKNKNNRGTADTVTRNQQRVVPQTGTGNNSGSSMPNEGRKNQGSKEY